MNTKVMTVKSNLGKGSLQSNFYSFTDAYRHMYKKMHKSMSSSFLLPQKHKPFGNSIERDPQLFDRLHSERLGKISMRVKEESIGVIVKQEKELTFHPKIANPFKRKRRSIDEFLNDMVRQTTFWLHTHRIELVYVY